ncbi:hypothetical protein [Streptomyces sp. NPDC051657]|uniref:hypothetical protein n=1 Tax=unclassified Streptomyces TaxID=2593676 RepID=UPI0034194EC9
MGTGALGAVAVLLGKLRLGTGEFLVQRGGLVVQIGLPHRHRRAGIRAGASFGEQSQFVVQGGELLLERRQPRVQASSAFPAGGLGGGRAGETHCVQAGTGPVPTVTGMSVSVQPVGGCQDGIFIVRRVHGWAVGGPGAHGYGPALVGGLLADADSVGQLDPGGAFLPFGDDGIRV